MLIGCVGEDEPLPDGPLRENDLARVKTVGAELIEGFEWDTVDLTDDQQVFSFFSLNFVWGSYGEVGPGGLRVAQPSLR